MNSLDIVTIALSVVLSSLMSIVVMWTAIKIKFRDADKAISAGMSALGINSAESRQLKAMEKSVASDLLNGKFPELTIILEQISPETLEMIKENPQIALKLLKKYEPLINKFLGGGDVRGVNKNNYEL